MFAFDEYLNKHPISGVQWNYVFMSSLLRSFEPKPAPCLRVLNELSNNDVSKDLLLVGSGLFKSGNRKTRIIFGTYREH